MLSQDPDPARTGTPDVRLVQPRDIDVEAAVLKHSTGEPRRVKRSADPHCFVDVEPVARRFGGGIGLQPFFQVSLMACRGYPQHVACQQHVAVGEPVRSGVQELP